MADENDETNSGEERAEEPETTSEDSEVHASMTSRWEENAKAVKAEQETHKEKFARLKAFFRGYWARKKWTLPLTILAVILIVLGVPFTRYKVLGLFLKHDAGISVLDSVTGRPVSGATVAVGSQSAETDAAGLATLHVPVGPHHFSVSKHYYKSGGGDVTVKLFGSQSPARVKLVATGRQVPVKVVDEITGKGLANVEIKVLDITARTDKDGKATVALPTKSSTLKANFSLSGYNDTTASIAVTDQTVSANTFKLTPAGKLYFLSNQSGTIDVVKTNLDGSDRQTVLAGTGKEDPNSTSLLASRDWKYLALLSNRSGTQSIYLINTSNDNVTNIDSGSATTSFNLIGWSDDTFVYQALHSNVSSWQSGAQTLRSYDAANSKLYNIDQTTGQGAQDAYVFTSFGFVNLVGNKVVYGLYWTMGGSNSDIINGKTNSIWSVFPDGSGKKDLQDIALSGIPWYTSLYAVPTDPNTLDIQSTVQLQPNSYYTYANGSVTQSTDLNDSTFSQAQQSAKTYLLSPSGRQALWSDIRDNKHVLFVGNGSGQAGKQIGVPDDYVPYGWYTDKYLLVTIGGSELYILPADGGKSPQKITDYYKPQLIYRGYGGAYGGV